MKIGIDMGHNVSCDGGAVGIRREDELNKRVGELLIQKLNNAGVGVFNCTPMVAASLGDSLYKRCYFANNENVDFFLSIHHNSGGGEGAEALVYKEGKGSEVGRAILSEIEALGFRNRGVKLRPDLYVIRNTAMPALLIECAFVDSYNDMMKYDEEKMAQALCNGILKAFNVAVGNNESEVYYTVQKGDILWAIARNYGTTVDKLVEMNGIKNRNWIVVGQRIRVG